MSKLKIMVTGGAGFIGTNLVRFLVQETKHEVINVDKLTYAGNLCSLEDVADHPRYGFEHVDIVDAAEVERLFKKHRPSAVMHLAAESHVDRSIDDPGAFVQTNIVGTFNLLHSARLHFASLPASDAAEFRFHHISTDEVFGSLGSSDSGFSESTPYDPHSPYSASKASSDHLVRAWHDTYRLPVLITNCSNNYGPFQFPEKLIPVVILKAISGQPIPVYGKGENIRDWLYVKDHVRALYRVLTEGRVGETYNIGGNNEHTNIDLVRMLCGILDRQMPIQDNSQLTNKQKSSFSSYADLITFVTDRPGHDLRYAIDATKIGNEINWTPAEDFDSGFQKTVGWYLDNLAWCENILTGKYQLQRQGLG